jgi:UDP-glucose 4-epimerase
LRILVTGSSGFIGTTFLESCAGAAELHGVDRLPSIERVTGVDYHVADLCAPDGLRALVRRISPDVIVHLAAQARVEPSLVDPVGTYRDNVVATINLIDAALQLGAGFRRFVYASSETVYGPAVTYPTPEIVSPNPQSPYAASKAASEMLVRSSLDDRALIVRSGMGYGPRSDPRAQVVARFVQRSLHNEPLMFPAGPVPGGHPTRDLNFVTNFVDGVRLALDAGVSGTFNIASGRELSILDLAQEVIRKVGSGRIEFDPAWTYRRGEEGLRTWLDITKAKDTFGYRPRVDLDEGLERTIRWMRGRLPE